MGLSVWLSILPSQEVTFQGSPLKLRGVHFAGRRIPNYQQREFSF
jgi:hypothetical protein